MIIGETEASLAAEKGSETWSWRPAEAGEKKQEDEKGGYSVLVLPARYSFEHKLIHVRLPAHGVPDYVPSVLSLRVLSPVSIMAIRRSIEVLPARR